jgi:hypothetical protein
VHRCVLPEVALEAHRPHARVCIAETLELGERPVGRPVVDEDQLEGARRFVERRRRPRVELAQPRLLVVDGNHDRDRRRRRIGIDSARGRKRLLADRGHTGNLASDG